ncbi:MAG TPA: hypothetical protein VHO72_05540 [Bacteroidales bacterium]|nr:hypothetical protein [Bacteroidales bacterium]
MKKYVFILALIISVAPSCKRKTIEQLNQKNQALSNLVRERDSIINQLVASFDELENTIGVEKQGGDATQRIKNDIEHLKNLLDENDQKYKSLQASQQSIYARARSDRSVFNSHLDSLNDAIAEKERRLSDLDRNIADLKAQAETQQGRIKRLTTVGASKSDTIALLTMKLNTGHYAVGKSNELKKREVIVKKGGFLGLFGRVAKLNPKFNPNEFNAINIQKDTIIPFLSKDAKMVTVHPSDTYTMVDSSNVRYLEITDPDKFWSASRYLVVENK